MLTADTVDSLRAWVSDRILVLVDQAGWPNFQGFRIPPARIEPGFRHAFHRSPYRNAALGLQKAYSYWPDSDWFLYTEYDCLFTSDAFKLDLALASQSNAWCVGFDLRRFSTQLEVLEQLLDHGAFRYSYYLLGCCQFLSNALISKLAESGFIDRLLDATSQFQSGYFPGYPRWAFEEELWPSIAVQFGASLYELACWKGIDRQWQDRITDDPKVIYAEGDDSPWRGKHRTYLVRFSPEINPLEHSYAVSIIHPVKQFENPIRIYHRGKRDAMRECAINGGFSIYERHKRL